MCVCSFFFYMVYVLMGWKIVHETARTSREFGFVSFIRRLERLERKSPDVVWIWSHCAYRHRQTKLRAGLVGFTVFEYLFGFC